MGENRAILLDDGRILEAAIELPGRLRAGAIVRGRLATILVPGRRGIAALDNGEECLIEPLPGTLTQGQAIRVAILREAIGEQGRDKLAKGRVDDGDPQEGPALRQRLVASGARVTDHALQGPDRFEEAGWTEMLEEAASGEIAFAGGALRMSLTPAMTLFDVDGGWPLDALAVAGADAAGRAIRRFGIGGSIGIDLPTLPGKAERQAAAAALDAALPQPFERTAVNGFGFLQIVRRRERASLPELIQGDAPGAAARALLRRAERRHGSGAVTLTAAPAVIARLQANPDWLETLSRRLGGPANLRAEAGLAISGGHVHSHFA